MSEDLRKTEPMQKGGVNDKPESPRPPPPHGQRPENPSTLVDIVWPYSQRETPMSFRDWSGLTIDLEMRESVLVDALKKIAQHSGKDTWSHMTATKALEGVGVKP